MRDSNVIGIMLWGSRATGLSTSDSDWDALVLVTNEYYNGLDVKETAFVVIDESTLGERSLKMSLAFLFPNDFFNNLSDNFDHALKTPTIDNIGQIENYLKEVIIAQGYSFPNDFLQMLLETVHRKGHPYVIKHSYL